MGTYRVTAPYVTLKVRDQAGAQVLSGFYEGAVVSDVDAVSLRHHLDNGMVVEVDSAEPAEAEPEPASDPVEPAATPNGRPPQNASKADWVTYAVSRRADGTSEDDAKAAAEAKSKADLIAEYGG